MPRNAHGCLSPQEWSEWIDGEVPPLVREAYQRHIERCDKCRREDAALALAVRALEEAGRDDVAPSPALRLKLKQLLAWEKRNPSLPHSRGVALRWAAVAAAAIILLCAGLLTWLPGASEKAQAYVDLYAEVHLRAEGFASDDLSPLLRGMGEIPW